MLAAKVPHVNGTWVGRIEKVKVYDRSSGEYDAAELHIEKGPAAKGYYPGDLKGFPGEGRVPVLTNWISPCDRAIDPSTLPVGRRVRVSGTLMVYPLCSSEGRGSVYRRKYPKMAYPIGEQILRVKGKLKVLD